MKGFVPGERKAQSRFFAENPPAEVTGYGASTYRLQPTHKALNLSPEIRATACA